MSQVAKTSPQAPYWLNGRTIAVAVLVVVTALAIVALPLVYATLLVAGAAVSIAILARPELALYLLAVTIPFESLRQLEVGGASVGATEALVGLLALSWLLRLAIAREREATPKALLLSLGLLLVVQVAATFRATELAPAIKEVVRWLEVFVVYLAGIDLLRPARRRAIVLVLLLAAAVSEALLGYVQFLLRLGPDAFRTGGFLRAYGTFGQPNPFAGYLGTVLPLTLALVLVGWTDRSVRGRGVYLASVAVFGLLLGVLLATMSRGGLLGFALAAGVIAILFDRRALIAALVGLAAGIFVVFLGVFNLLPPQIGDRLVQIVAYFGVFDVRTVELTPANWAVVERMAIWQAAWGMFEANPILGVGPGNYPMEYKNFSMPGWWDSMGHAHNLYLNFLAETGAVGLAGFLVFWFTAVWVVWRAHRRTGAGATWWRRAIPLGVLGVLAQVSLHNMFDNLTVHGLNVQLALLLSLATWSADEEGRVVPQW